MNLIIRSKKIIASLLFLFFVYQMQAQIFTKKNYPKDFFAWPVDAQVGIVANFGELRPNHFHMGLDCRTDHHENVVVMASGDGYIAKDRKSVV